MSRAAWTLLLVAAVAGAQETPPDLALPAAILRHAERVSTAAAAPTLEAELVAARELHAAGPRAAGTLRALAREATLPGRVLALCVLEVQQDPEREALRAALAAVDGEVAVAWDPERPLELLPLREVLATRAPDAVRRAPGAPPAEWGFSRGTPDVQGGGLPWGVVLQPAPGDPDALADLSLEAWLERLALPNRWIREEAEAALVALGPAAVEPLRASLEAPERTRWAARVLGRLGLLAVPAVDALARGLAAPEPAARLACARALGELGPYASRAQEALAARAAQPDELLSVRLACAARLRALPTWAPGVEALPATLQLELWERAQAHPDPELRHLAAGLERIELPPGAPGLALARRLVGRGVVPPGGLEGPDATLDLILEAVTCPFAQVRAEARDALRQVPDVEAALARRLEADGLAVRATAALGLFAVEAGTPAALDALAQGLAQPELALALVYGLDTVVLLLDEVLAPLVELATGDHPAAELACERLLDLTPAGRAVLLPRLRARLDGPQPARALLLALRSGDAGLQAEAEARLRTGLKDEAPEVRRQAAALLIEGQVAGEAAALAWGELALGAADGDPQVPETLELWAREPALARPAPEQALAWLEGKDLCLAAWAAGEWFPVAGRAGPRARKAALSALLRLIATPRSLPARILARRAFSDVPELVYSTLEEGFGTELGGVIYRGLLAALAVDPDGPWAAATLHDLLLDVDLVEPERPEAWSALFSAALPRAQPWVRWRLVRALGRLGTQGAPAAPALRRASLAAEEDPELRLAIEETLRTVLGA